MATRLNPAEPTPTVVVIDGEVHIDNFVDADPVVVDALIGADDPVRATHSLLRVGAEAVGIAAADLNTDIVERRFNWMTNTFDATVSGAVAEVAKTANNLLDAENGALPTMMGRLRVDLEKLLGDTFDPDSKSSVIATIAEAVEEASGDLLRSVEATFSLDHPDSPLSRTKRDMVEVVKDEAKAVLAELRELSTTLAIQKERREVEDKLTAKGTTFEETVNAGLGLISSIHGDVVELVGTGTGVKGTKTGDLVVTINPDDTTRGPVRFVIEAKTGSLSMIKTRNELDMALTNRDASAAIAVFATQKGAPTTVPLWYSGNHAVLVYDKDDPDQGALRLAYEWARWVSRRGVDDGTFDTQAIHSAIDRARQALKRHQQVKACHATIKKQADEASSHVAGLVTDVEQAIDALVEAVKGDPGTAAA